MSQISVDPDALRQSAQRLAAAADRLRALGDEVSEVGSSAPSYEGQFGPQVNSLSLEASATITAQIQRLSELSEQLTAKADEFAQADQVSQSAFAALSTQIFDWLHSLQSSLLGPPSPQPTSTPVPTPQAVPVPTPEITGTPIPQPPSEYEVQLALNSKYGFCVYPLTDPDANENRIVIGQMTFGKGPYSLPPGPAPGRPWEGVTDNKFLIGMKVFGLLYDVASGYANRDIMENAAPNVDFRLHYSRYDEGIRVAGVRVDNQYDIPIKVFWADIYEGAELPDGSVLIQNAYSLQFRVLVPSGETEYIAFEGLPEGPFPNHSAVQVHVTGSTLEYERQYRRIGWRINVENGEAHEVAPGWSELP